MKKTPSKKSKSSRDTSSAGSASKVKTTTAASPAKTAEAEIADRNARTLLGQILVELGYVTVYQLDEALHAQRTERANQQEQKIAGHEQKPLGQIMLELGYCTPNQLIRAIQVQSDYRKAAVRFRDNW